MSSETERDETLERLWQLRERGASTVGGLSAALRGRWQAETLKELAADGLATVAGDPGEPGTAIALTPAGAARAERLIRAHRIGERLIHDVLNREFESGACELEHIVATEIVDGICTLLGHPRECPHGFPIPEGDCCRSSARWAQKIVVPLTELAVGQSARVAWVHAHSDQQLHRLSSLQIRPGTTVKLHQTSPSYVIECDGASVALDDSVARTINVWLDVVQSAAREIPAAGGEGPPPAAHHDRRRRFRAPGRH